MIRILAPLLLACVAACTNTPPQGSSTPYPPSAGMLKVLDEWQAMHSKERSDLSVAEAREVPSLVEAAQATPNAAGRPAPTIAGKQPDHATASCAAGPA